MALTDGSGTNNGCNVHSWEGQMRTKDTSTRSIWQGSRVLIL